MLVPPVLAVVPPVLVPPVLVVVPVVEVPAVDVPVAAELPVDVPPLVANEPVVAPDGNGGIVARLAPERRIWTGALMRAGGTVALARGAVPRAIVAEPGAPAAVPLAEDPPVADTPLAPPVVAPATVVPAYATWIGRFATACGLGRSPRTSSCVSCPEP